MAKNAREGAVEAGVRQILSERPAISERTAIRADQHPWTSDECPHVRFMHRIDKAAGNALVAEENPAQRIYRVTSVLCGKVSNRVTDGAGRRGRHRDSHGVPGWDATKAIESPCRNIGTN